MYRDDKILLDFMEELLEDHSCDIDISDSLLESLSVLVQELLDERDTEISPFDISESDT